MASILRLLSNRGIQISSEGTEATADELRRVLETDRGQIETDQDGSRRLRLTDKNDQLTLTPEGELVFVHGDLSQDSFDIQERFVRARSTAKAAHQLAKLRLWQAVESGLREAQEIDRPNKPATLADWLRENDEEAQRLLRQLDILGLTAEKTHEFSALVFEPERLTDFRKREKPFSTAVAAFYIAEALRATILAEAAKRITRKGRFDPAERDRYLAQREKLSTRAGRLYATARDLFTQAGAAPLAKRCEELVTQYSASATSSSAPAATARPQISSSLGVLSAKREVESVQKLIEPGDTTLLNTVRAINTLTDGKMQSNLATHFVTHVVTVAKRLDTAKDVARLLQKLDEMKAHVTDGSFINLASLARCRGLILRERTDVLPLVGKRV